MVGYEYRLSHRSRGCHTGKVDVRDVGLGLVESTTAHGIPHIHHARGALKICFWSFMFLLAIGGLIGNVTLITMTYFAYPVDVSIRLLHENELTFPAVTVCNMSPIKKSALINSGAFNEVSSKRRRRRSVSGICPPTWIFNDTSCYLVQDYNKKHVDATAICASYGANLTTIQDKQEQDFVFSITYDAGYSGDFFIGLEQINGIWVLPNGETATYFRWDNGEPGGGDNCVRMDDNTMWKAKDCGNKLKFTCEKAAFFNDTTVDDFTTLSPEITTTATSVQSTQAASTSISFTIDTNSSPDLTTNALEQSTREATSTIAVSPETETVTASVDYLTTAATTLGDTIETSTVITPETSGDTTTRKIGTVSTTEASGDTTTKETSTVSTTEASGDTTSIETSTLITPEATTVEPTSSSKNQTGCCCTCCATTNPLASCQSCNTTTGVCQASTYHNPYTAIIADINYTTPTEIEEPQPVPGSLFTERVLPRESFQQEEELAETLAEMKPEDKALLGSQATEFILDCQYEGKDCSATDFDTFQNPVHGNCFIFNSGWNSTTGLFISHKPGRRHGLHLIINIDQDEYVEETGETAGLRLVIKSQNTIPFPEDEGVIVRPGQTTAIGMKMRCLVYSQWFLTVVANQPMVGLPSWSTSAEGWFATMDTMLVVKRQGWPYGTCVDRQSKNITRNAYEAIYPVRYSQPACIKTCYQRHLVDRCACADPYYPTINETSTNMTAPTCESSNIVQDDCRYEVFLEFQRNDLNCDCPTSCQDKSFSLQTSMGLWPSEVRKDMVFKTLAKKVPQLLTDNSNPNKVKDNLIKLEVYYEEFNFEQMEEMPGYLPGNYLSDIGGVMGLWLGMSILTIFEFVEFFMDISVLWMYNLFIHKNKNYKRNLVAQEKYEMMKVRSLNWYHGGKMQYGKINITPKSTSETESEKQSFSHLTESSPSPTERGKLKPGRLTYTPDWSQYEDHGHAQTTGSNSRTLSTVIGSQDDVYPRVESSEQVRLSKQKERRRSVAKRTQ